MIYKTYDLREESKNLPPGYGYLIGSTVTVRIIRTEDDTVVATVSGKLRTVTTYQYSEDEETTQAVALEGHEDTPTTIEGDGVYITISGYVPGEGR